MGTAAMRRETTTAVQIRLPGIYSCSGVFIHSLLVGKRKACVNGNKKQGIGT
jgi:hypothetical protein